MQTILDHHPFSEHHLNSHKRFKRRAIHPTMSQPNPRHDPLIDLDLLEQRRNRWARHAKAQDFLLRRVSEDLCARLAIIKREFPKTLILGAHHGIVGKEIAPLDNLDWIISSEATDALRTQCAGTCIKAHQEWLPFKDGSLDLVLSPLNFHYANDLPGTLIQIRRALKNDGLLLGAMLGGRTLTELRQAWLQAEAEITGGASPRVAPFADIRDVGALLQRAGFALPVVDSERLTVNYASPLALMQELKAMASSNPLVARSRRPATKQLLKRACEIYSDQCADPNSGRCPATFEILTLSAWAPDDSQQKPLPRGSAKMRLADALRPSKPSGDGDKSEQ